MHNILVTSLIAALAPVLSCSVNSAWGLNTVTTSTATSSARTISVPKGNIGKIFINILNDETGGAVFSYNINSGSNITFTGPTEITVLNGDTLSFRMTGLEIDGTGTISVSDKMYQTNRLIGTWQGTRIS